jgi:hypothetical protein
MQREFGSVIMLCDGTGIAATLRLLGFSCIVFNHVAGSVTNLGYQLFALMVKSDDGTGNSRAQWALHIILIFGFFLYCRKPCRVLHDR